MTQLTPEQTPLSPAEKLAHVRATIFTPEQLAAMDQAMAILRAVFPNQTDRRVVAHLAAANVVLPPYSTLQHALLANVAHATIGASVLFYGQHPQTNQMVIVMIRRSEIGADGQHQVGVLGGYTNPGFHTLTRDGVAFHSGEQPQEGVLRESTAEELVDDRGQPILAVDRSRLVIIHDGTDEHALRTWQIPTHFTCYAARLSDVEMRAVFQHSQLMHTDADYGQRVREAARGEINLVELVNLSQAAEMTPVQFTHAHELVAVKILHTYLQTPPDQAQRPSLLHRALTGASPP